MVDTDQAKRQRFTERIRERAMEFVEERKIPLPEGIICPAFEDLKSELAGMAYEFEKKEGIPIVSIEIWGEPEFDRDGMEKTRYTFRVNCLPDEPNSPNPGEVGE